ncbi:ABC-F family ATP-binding cassette domain-containing protein [Polluticaenibacter yanchengensis]|uniref:ABC-F family ATP-binding cassette domain-containing protein n=1 Tax=Polluticaenibacter yanchengensis TaxID=3014562 RepID=A0ABT4UMP4_9BACT|nr:ABC-F family ATP-binding cassette domain-containing protein [Chitinophagaceae bacterium LY-5]
MHYLSVENLSKAYGVTPLFDNISFNINEGDKIALVARNGVGKSTMLKILAGKEHADKGKVWIHKDVKVILFEQEPNFDESKSIGDNIFNHDHPVLNAIRLYEIALEKSETEPGEENNEALQTALQQMADLNAWTFEAKVKQILGKLNIHHLDAYVSSLSGGQRKRVALARTLIDVGFDPQHSMLLMDEPTNHLDVEMIEWLENYLGGENVTLLMVSHDRYFLDAVSDVIWEMESSNIYHYTGDYANYLEKKAARIESALATIDKAKNTYRRELDWMRRQPKARTTKSKSRQDNFYEIEAVAKQRIVDQQLQLQVKMSRLGGKVAEMKKVYKSYGDKKILDGFDYTFSKGERIGVVGKNGVGKSTFMNILQGLEQPDSGKINIGDTVIFGNYDQQGLQWKEDMRVIEYVKQFAETFPLANGGALTASKFLELFLFTADKQYTFLSALSGGEKRRLQLLTILFKNPNFLILDEPTNDLDLPTLEVLENFLTDYQGCVMIVSHDRYFMDKLVDHLFVFEGDGVVRDYPGNYSQYRIDEQLEEDKRKEAQARQADTANAAKTETPAVAADKRKVSFKDKREFELLEKEMPELEKERDELNATLNAGISNYEEMMAVSTRVGQITQLLEEKEMRWLELSELIG